MKEPFELLDASEENGWIICMGHFMTIIGPIMGFALLLFFK